MQYQASMSFDTDPDTLLKMFTDKDYFLQKYQRMGCSEVELVEHEDDGTNFRIMVKMKQTVDIDIPSFAKKFVASEVTVIQEDRWDRSTRKGTLNIDLQGQPTSMAADMHVEDAVAGGCVNRLDWTVTCKVPLVGGKLEKLVVEDMRKKEEVDLAASRDMLESYT